MHDKYGVQQDPYCYPGSTVLRNLLNIQDSLALEEAERHLTEIRASEFDTLPDTFDLSTLQRIHRQLFGDIYAWAGELRSVDISKGDEHFCHQPHVQREAQKLFDKLADASYFKDLDTDTFVLTMADFYNELNVIHPFREGNGWAQRVLSICWRPMPVI